MADAPPLPPLLMIPEAAEFLRVTERTVYRHLASGALPSVQFGRSRRIRREDLEAFIGTRAPAEVA